MTTPWLRWEDAQASALYQGIDYLELLLTPSEEQPASATLVVHLQRTWAAPPKFSATSFALSGGRRITDLSFTYVSEDPVERTVTLALSAIGDASEYTLTLLGGGDQPIHPFFAAASFVFTLACEKADCRPLAAEPPRLPVPRPAVDLLTKDYDGFVQLLSDWVRVRNPSWADLAPASLERVLVELLAHHGDMLSYYQDRVANEAFIDTASQRYSLRQHATLLGTRLFEGSAAETLLAFTASDDGYVPAETEVSTSPGADGAPVVFWLTERTRVLAAHSDMKLAAWPGAKNAVVPAGATEILLWGHVDDLAVGQRLAFVQGDLGGLAEPAQIVRITAATQDEQLGWTASPDDPPHANASDVTIVTFDPPLQRDLRPFDAAAPLHVHGNLGHARFGERKAEAIVLSEATFAADPQSYVLEHRPGSRPLLRALRLNERPVVFEAHVTASGVTVTSARISLRIGSEVWEQSEHLHGSRSYDRHFVVSADEDGSVWLEFGDNEHGRAITALTSADVALAKANATDLPTIEVEYRVGDPVAGNVGAGVLDRFRTDPASLLDFTDLEVVNVLPGTGGRRPETKDAIRLRIPASLRHGPVERAVSLADYTRAAVTVEGVARATTKELGGPFNAVLVLVDPKGQTELSESLKRAVYDRIDALRMAGREHFVTGAEYVPIEIRLAICVQPGMLPHRVRDAVIAALRPGTADSPGYFHPDRLSFRDSLEVGEILALVQRIPGVRSVKALRFRKLGVASQQDVEHRILFAPTEVARMDGDENVPENGKLKVLIVGIDPGVTENDFVIEEVQ